ncbi:DUF4365 domain-containing protein [Mycolicibacterium sp. jd]|uniref:DUF4365 domain-containing protein n=1 Tax=unclassified Mycolicibacterium TaxID=2636767 RepID=UPI00351AD8A5
MAAKHLLDDKHSKSRYSLAYLFALCAQAGYTAEETRQDEDIHAIDATVKLVGASVYVQLKCTEVPNKTQAGYRVDFEDEWIEKWQGEHLPVYIILIVVVSGQTNWIEHPDDASTLHRAAAFWGRFDAASDAKSITISASNRLTVDSMKQWQSDIDELFGGGGGA